MPCARRLLLVACLALAVGQIGPAAAGEDRAQKRITSSENYLPVGPLSGALTANYQFKGLIVVDSGLDIPDAALRQRAEKSMPLLKDGLRTAVAQYVAVRYHIGAAPDADAIAVMMQTAADRTLGQPGAKLLLSSVMIQPGGR
jgi:hypothetical protein